MKISERYTNQGLDNLSIKEAFYIGDFAIRIAFTNGNSKLVDFKPFLEQSNNPSIKKYLDEALFKAYQIKDGNLDWNDFELCFPIGDLYTNTLLKEESKILTAR